MSDRQTTVVSSARGRIVTMDSAYFVDATNCHEDVVVNSSYCGVLPARFMAQHRPRAVIGMDCGIGAEGAGIAGLWYLEALGIPAAVADIMSLQVDSGASLHADGVVSRFNAPAGDCGVEEGMAVSEAARRLLEQDPVQLPPDQRIRRVTVDGLGARSVVCLDSIAFGLPEDAETNVLCTGGHGGVSAVANIARIRPWAFICSDGGRGRDDVCMEALTIVEAQGIAGATVSAQSARMGDGVSTWADGVISGCNVGARQRGVELGQSARMAARLLLTGDSPEQSEIAQPAKRGLAT